MWNHEHDSKRTRLCSISHLLGVLNGPFFSRRWISVEVNVGVTFIHNPNGTPIMGVDGVEGQHPIKASGKGLNYLGSFLLISSSSIIFTPLLENFPGLAPNGWEILVWILWGIAIFAYAVILLIVNNVFRFLENQSADRSTSQPTRNWVRNLKTLGTSFLLWCALWIILWTLPG